MNFTTMEVSTGRNHMSTNFDFVNMHFPFNVKDAIRVVDGNKTVDEYADFIKKNSIEKAEIIMSDLEILRKCQCLKYLKILPSIYSSSTYDFTPLYDSPKIISLNCFNCYGEKNQFISEIDYSKIVGLVELFVFANKGALNFSRIKTLKSLKVGGFKGEKSDISDLFSSEQLDTLTLIQCQIKSLEGIQNSKEMQCLYLYHNRSLENINALQKVKKTLKALRIQNCPKIKDFTVLGELTNLELLELTGSNEVPNLDFLKKMKNLKTFIFNFNVKDGDLSNCLALSYVY